MRYEQYPENPHFADAEYAKKWVKGEWIYMNDKEQEEFLLYGPKKVRKAIRGRRKAREQAQKKQSQS